MEEFGSLFALDILWPPFPIMEWLHFYWQLFSAVAFPSIFTVFYSNLVVKKENAKIVFWFKGGEQQYELLLADKSFTW